MNATISDLVEQVRFELDEVTLSGEMVLTDSDLQDTASSNFSDASIKDRLLDATVYIASRVRATHLDSLMVTLNPSNFDPPYDATSPKILRLLSSRVTAENTDSTPKNIEATRRTMAQHLKMETGRGLNANEDYPVYVFQDFELLIENGENTVKEAKAIRVPERQPDNGGGDDDVYSDVTNLPGIFEAAVVEHAVFSCFETLRLAENANNAKKRLMEELSPYRLPFRSMNDQQQEQEG